MVWTAHGQLPVPAYATLRLMCGMKTCQGPGGDKMTGELVTPTAAALLRVLTGVAQQEKKRLGGEGGVERTDGKFTYSYSSRPPNFTPRFIGIGAGTKDFPDHANIVRLIIGDEVVIMDTRIKKTVTNTQPHPPMETLIVLHLGSEIASWVDTQTADYKKNTHN